MRRRGVAVAIGCAAWAVGLIAHAQDVPDSPSKLPERRAIVAREASTRVLHATFSYRDVVDADVQRKLQSGLTTVIVLAGGVFEADRGGSPVPGTGVWQSCRVTFDVWNEVYRLQIARPEGDRKAVAVNLEGVLRRCTEVRALPVQGVLTPSARYFLAATVEVNPVSQEMLEQIRRWVSRPPGSGAVSPGDSLFGSFVGLFVARIGKADRTISFRTQTFVMPP
jgi:hypothetical protein